MSAVAAEMPLTVRASDVEPEPIEWLWKDRIPSGALSLIAGRPGQGKSLFSAWLAAETTRRRKNVLLSNLEDSAAQVVRPRLEASGANLRRVHFWSPLFPDGLGELERRIRALNLSLVILDPIAAHFDRGSYDDRALLAPLHALAEATHCAIVALHHTRKSVSRGAHPLEAILGTGGGLAAAARAVWLFGPNPADEDERVLAFAKGNWGKKPPASIFEVDEHEILPAKGKKPITTAALSLQDDEAKIDASAVASITTGAKAAVNVGKKAKVAAWLTDYLATGEQPANAIREDAKQRGWSWATIRRAAEAIEVVKQRHGFGPGSEIRWSLPDGHPALLMPLPTSSDEEGDGDE